MPDELIKSSRRVLDPIDRVTEVLFGLIMVLTFTGSLSVAGAGRDDVRAMIAGAVKVPFMSVRFPAVEPLYESKPGWRKASSAGARTS
jgi:hypothetical protein